MTQNTEPTTSQVENLQNEKKLYFDVAYKTYTRLAEIADEVADLETRQRIFDAIEDLGRTIGRTEPRERPR